MINSINILSPETAYYDSFGRSSNSDGISNTSNNINNTSKTDSKKDEYNFSYKPSISKTETNEQIENSASSVLNTKKTDNSEKLENKNNSKTKKKETNTQTNNTELDKTEQQEVESLKKTDKEVKAHEQAHKSAGGGLVRGSSYSYKTGPDGKRYVVGGEVNIDISAIDGDLQATINKMQQVKRAALAPSDPSSQDRKVAAEAEKIMSNARRELLSTNNSDSSTNKQSSINNKLMESYQAKNTSSSIGTNIDYSIGVQGILNLKNILY